MTIEPTVRATAAATTQPGYVRSDPCGRGCTLRRRRGGSDDHGCDRSSRGSVHRRGVPLLREPRGHRCHAGDAVREGIQEAALPQFSDESLERDAEAVITDFLTGFRRALDQLPGARGLLSAVFTRPTVQENILWTAHVERFIQRYAPGLRPARRRQAAYAYQVITTALMTGATRSGQGIAPQLMETRSFLLGYTNQLALEAAAERKRTGDKTRRR